MSEDIRYLQKIRDIPRLQPYIKQGVVSTGRHLGKGAFGYVVELQLYGAVCAGKKIHEAFLDPQNKGVQHIVDKFITECELMSQMHHPNIVHFYGLAFLDDSFSPVLIMERLDKSLDDLLETIPAKDVLLFLRLSILYDVAKGLVFLHSYQPPIIHRDLTARNILLTSTKQAKIADLGNSRIIDTEALSRSLSQTPGTLVYMPPEAIGTPAIYDTSLDTFSFGHMSLFVFGHRFPSPLLRLNYNDPNSHPPNKLCARSEVERRVAYFEEIERMKAIPAKLIGMVKLCLDNMPECRPTSQKVSEILGHYKERVEKQRKSVTIVEQQPPSPGATGTRRRSDQMTKIMSGSSFVMEMQICHGKKKNQCSKRCVLHLEDGKLKYQILTDKKVQELKLDSVISVEPVYEAPQFRFAVYFEHKKEKKAWYFKADTEEDRNCWVTALRGFINSSQPDLAYEIVHLTPEPPCGSRREPSHPLPPTPLRSRLSEAELSRLYSEADAASHQKAKKVAFSRQAVSLRKPPKHKPSKGIYEHFKPHYHEQFCTNTNPSYKVLSAKPQMQGAMPVFSDKKRDSLAISSQIQMPDSSKKISLQECKVLGNTSEDYDDVVPKQIQQTHPDELYDEIDSRYANITGAPLTPLKPQFFRERSHVLLKKPIIKESAASRPRSAEVQIQDEQTTPVRGGPGVLMPGLYSGNKKNKIMRVRSSSPTQRSHEGERKMLRFPSIPNHRYPAHEDALPQQQKGPSKPLHELLGTLHIPDSNLFEWKLIANGEFGDIYHAKLRNLTGEMVDVAVKTLQAYEDSKDMANFENEMAISADPLINHPNIVKVYGLVEGADQIVMEYLPYGDLKSFLSKNSQLLAWLIKYMLDIAEGMAFLSERGLIHRDLAARNILMASRGETCMTCKVSDFGLLRKLPTDANYYFQTKSSKCPIRWMAPESLGENKFSTASDVWSYGIVIWEMFNPDHVPYEEYINIQVAVKITQGVKLKIPSNCPADIAQIMSSCWKEKSSDRPTFRELASQLTNRH